VDDLMAAEEVVRATGDHWIVMMLILQAFRGKPMTAARGAPQLDAY
jgi:hypothetical protein